MSSPGRRIRRRVDSSLHQYRTDGKGSLHNIVDQQEEISLVGVLTGATRPAQEFSARVREASSVHSRLRCDGVVPIPWSICEVYQLNPRPNKVDFSLTGSYSRP